MATESLKEFRRFGQGSSLQRYQNHTEDYGKNDTGREQIVAKTCLAIPKGNDGVVAKQKPGDCSVGSEVGPNIYESFTL